jgi:putative ABC transport system permease protein
MFRIAWKNLLANKLKLVLMALAIVLGVGFVAGTYVLTDTMNAAFDDLFSSFSADTDVVVRAQNAFDPGLEGGGAGTETGREPVSESVLPKVQAVPGVASAYGDVSGYALMIDPATDKPIGGMGPPPLGVSWTDESTLAEIREGAAPVGADQVAVDAFTAEKYGINVGDKLEIQFQGGVASSEFTVTGIIGFGDLDNLGGANVAAFELPVAQHLFGKDGEFDSINVVGDDGVVPAQLASQVQDVLPSGVEAVTSSAVADEQADALKEGLGFFRTVLLVFAAVALFVGAFIIFNTFSIVVGQRIRELGLLRTLGAGRRQILLTVVVEALIVAVFASAIGIAFGVLIALGLRAAFGVIGIELPGTSVQIEPRTIVVAMAIGIVVTLIAAIVPARHAASVSPMEALREPDAMATGGGMRRRIVAGAIIGVVGVLALAVGLFGKPDNAATIVGLGAALTFIGVAMLAPLVTRPVVGVLGAPLRRLGVQSRLGRENAMRNPRRTSTTASALMIGLGLVTMVAVLGASLKASFTAALEETLKADFTLSTTSLTPFSPDVAAKASQTPGVQSAVPFRQGAFRVDGGTSFLMASDPATLDQVASLDVSQGSTADLAQPDTVMVYADLANEKGWTLGSTVPAAFSTVGDKPMKIVGIYDENRLVGDYVTSIETYEGLFTEQLDSFVLVKTEPGADPAQVRTAIQSALSSYANVDVQDQAAFREKQAGFVDTLLNFVTVLLLMAIVIAVFGIINTLTLSIYERTRELGLLRAVGLSRRQTKRMVRWEAVLIAAFGATLGIIVGIAFGWALQQALASEGVTELRIPVPQLIVYFAIAALIGVLAAIWPARRAAKLNVLEAVSYE